MGTQYYTLPFLKNADPCWWLFVATEHSQNCDALPFKVTLDDLREFCCVCVISGGRR